MPMSLRLERMLAMDAAIRGGSYPNVAVFMGRFEVSERTIHGDLAFMRARFNAPLHYNRLNGGYCYTDPTWVLPNFFVTEGELLAFFLSVELTRRYLGTAFETPLRKMVDLLASSLPDELQIDLSALTQHYTFQPGATVGADATLLMTLFECMRERWPIDMTYLTASTGERKQRVIEPYHLFNVRGDWQVVAFDHRRQGVRQFAVSRIEAWTVLRTQRFVRDPGFSVVQYLSTGFLAERGDQAIEIEVWFDSYQARYMRGREFHPSQQIEEHNDGSLTVRLSSGALDEVRRWVMSFGRHAKVIAPTSLAAEIAAEAAEVARLYNGGENS
jgi:predicted DNA-binding transcriptional regulator YafY